MSSSRVSLASLEDPAPLDVNPKVSRAKRRWQRAVEWEGTARDRFVDDLRFRHGDSDNGWQWPSGIRQARDRRDKPCLTMNVIRQHNLQIANTELMNKSEMEVKPVGNGATVESALMINHLLARIEDQSGAQEIYAQGRGFQIDGGVGYWRVVTDYLPGDTFEQDFFLRPIPDPLGVYLDPDTKFQHGGDANWGFVFDRLAREQFRDAYPDFQGLLTSSALGGVGTTPWMSEDYVQISEYYERVPKKHELLSFVHPGTGERTLARASLLPENVLEVVRGHRHTRSRQVDGFDVEWTLFVGEQIADETTWPGQYIPIIRCEGERTIIDGVLDRKGHTRAMKDAQRMYNFNAALALDTPVPTPFGWTTMGELKQGSWVFDHKGFPVQVAKALPVRENELCYKITFDNGQSVVADAGHIWFVEEKGKRKSATFDWQNKTISTAELIEGKHFIKITEALHLADEDFALDPYLLGTWLGDGHKGFSTISCHIDDVEEQRQLVQAIGYECAEATGFVGRGCVFTVKNLRKQLNDLGILNDKRIPDEYLRGSTLQRLALLQGLMDTDGHYAKAINNCVFVNNNKAIAAGVLELCASLGIKATVKLQPGQLLPTGKYEGYFSQPTYRVQFTADPNTPVFRLSRKASAQQKERPIHWRRTKRLAIVSVVEVPSVPVRCITLDTPERLFLCGHGMIPTHNSGQVEHVALQNKIPYVAPAKAIEGFENYWGNANTEDHAVLPWNHVDDDGNTVPKPERQIAPQSSPGLTEGMNTAFQQMKMVSGQWENQMGQAGSERTGEAISQRQEQGDVATYHFKNNFRASQVWTAKVILDAMPRVYDTKRVVTYLGDDGVDREVEIDPSARQAYLEERGHDQEVAKRVLNPAIGRYEVKASTGNTATQREQTVKAITLLLTQSPELVKVLGDILLKNMDIPGAQEAAQRLYRMVPPQALGKGPTPQEAALQQKVNLLQANLAKTLQQSAKDSLLLAGKDQMRDIDVYKAKTDRLKALADQLAIDPQDLLVAVQQLLEQSAGDDQALEGVEAANAAPGTPGTGVQQQGAGAPPDPSSVPGARQAPDGQWYVPDPQRAGGWLRLDPADSPSSGVPQ